MSNNEPKNSKPESSALYPLIIFSGVIISIGSFVINLQAIVAALGLSVSMILIGVGVLGWFINQGKISFQDGVQYSIIWTLLILLAGGGYYVIINRPININGSLVDNNLDRNPVKGYEIELYSHETGNTSVVRTDDEGKFTFGDIKNGEYDLIINGVIVRSQEATSGWRRMVQGDINAGRFYLDNLAVVQAETPTPNGIPSVPTGTVTPTVTSTATVTSTLTASPTQTTTRTITPTRTVRPTNTHRPTNTPRPTNTLTLTPTDVPQESILYEEDFEDGFADSWYVHFGEWSIVDDGSGNTASRIEAGSADSGIELVVPLDSHVIEFKYSFAESASANLNSFSFIYLNIWQVPLPTVDDCPEYSLTIKAERIDFARIESGTHCPHNILGGIPFQSQVGIYHTARLEINQEGIRVYVDGSPVGQSRDPLPTNEWDFNIGTWQFITVYIDDIRVWSVDS